MKKIISSMAALAIAVSSASIFTSSAINNPRDPNGDGYINTADAVYINQFLGGAVLPYSLTPLDFDQNGLITLMDAKKVQWYKLGLYNPPDQNINDPIEHSVASTRTYRRHDYSSTNSQTYTEYTISNSTSLNSIGDDTDTIFGNNDMIRDYDTSVVRLSCGGTGFIVDNHIIATAAHCVYDISTDEFFDLDIDIVDSNNNVIDTLQPSYSHIPKSFAQLTSYSSNYDYALIYVEEDISQYGMFKLGQALDYYDDNNGQVIVSGFPSIYPSGYQNAAYGLRFKASGNLLGNSSSTCLHYNTDMAPGDSGGPVYVEEEIVINDNLIEYRTAVGINVAQTDYYNLGLRIDGNILKFYYQNNNITA